MKLSLTKEQLAGLLRAAERAHGEYERRVGHRDENWPDWYAEFIVNALDRER